MPVEASSGRQRAARHSKRFGFHGCSVKDGKFPMKQRERKKKRRQNDPLEVAAQSHSRKGATAEAAAHGKLHLSCLRSRFLFTAAARLGLGSLYTAKHTAQSNPQNTSFSARSKSLISVGSPLQEAKTFGTGEEENDKLPTRCVASCSRR